MKKKTVFSGAATALVTPFCDGEIDYATLGALIEMQIAGGIDALVIGGTTGEAATLSDKERHTLYSFAKEKINGRTGLILGTGTNDTRVVLEHSRFAEELGCDGILLVTPYYNKGTEEGIARHYLTIAESVDLPIILYNVPSRTGVNLGLNLLSRLAEHENIVGIKEASDSADRLVELAAFGEELALYAGNDSQLFSVLSLGGRGIISVISNILPDIVVGICRDFECGRTRAAMDMQLLLLPFIKFVFLETNPVPIKYAMSLCGGCREEVRLPLGIPRESTRRAVAEELVRLRSKGILK